MAFPVPSHLPRSVNQQNKLTQILSKIGETSTSEFTASLAASWIAELDDSIQQTKEQIKSRISSDLPTFESQLASSKSVQTRLQDLARNVDQLSDSVANSETGLGPVLVRQIKEYSALSQNALDAQVKYQALSHLSNCISYFESLSDASEHGNLVAAVKLVREVQTLIDESPEPLPEAVIMFDLKQRVQVVQRSVEEQLDEAYERSIKISQLSIAICPAVQVRQSQTIITLPDILSSLSSSSLLGHLSILRRDLTQRFIGNSLKQSHSVGITSTKDELSTNTIAYSLFPSSPEDPSYSPPFKYLSSLLNFLSEHLFSALPTSERTSFLQSLSSPLTDSILQNLLLPSIPSSAEALRNYLDFLQDAVEFERSGIVDILDKTREREVASWAENISQHYSRRRRTELLATARVIILNIESATEAQLTRVEVESEDQSVVEDVPKTEGTDDIAVDADAWDLDDDVPVDNDELATKEQPRAIEPESVELHQADVNDPSDAWGWDDDEQNPEENTVATESDENHHTDSTKSIEESDQPAWDAWNEPEAGPLSPATQPKQAKRLEKFSLKHKIGQSGNVDSNSSTSSYQSDAESLSHVTFASAARSSIAHDPASIFSPSTVSQTPVATIEKETYQITGCAKEIIGFIDNILLEGDELAHSTVFDDFLAKLALSSSVFDTATNSGNLIKSTALSVLELHRALYPVFHEKQLDSSLARSMLFANDCNYLNQEVSKRTSNGRTLDTELKQGLQEVSEEFLYLAEEWTQTTVQRAQAQFKAVLSRASGFVDTADQNNFDEYEILVLEVLRDTTALGREWKKILPSTKYYWAIGMVVEASLTKLIEDILALRDITEVESHRLSELCKILHALEKLFIQNADMSSVAVVYVPSWLKFSYLSELLEGSIADITYLFDEGALVDFELNELVGLVRALFADTPIRANAIARLMNSAMDGSYM